MNRLVLPAGLLLVLPVLTQQGHAQDLQEAEVAAPYTQRDVSFRNGAVELQGTVVLPTVEGRSPAIVFLHGSGPMTREGFRPYAEEFAKLGVASLAFDRRGTGSSGGSWTTSSLDDLVGDALAAVRYLKTEERVDPAGIGFWGISQAAWIAPRAAATASPAPLLGARDAVLERVAGKRAARPETHARRLS